MRLFLHYGDLADGPAREPLARQAAARRGLQPRRAEPRAGLLRRSRSTRSTSPALGTLRLLEAIREAGVDAALLPGVLARRCSARPRRRRARPRRSIRAAPTASPRSPRYWIDRQLPRGLRDVRRQRHPLQPRVAAARRDVRDAQDHAGRRAHQGRAAGQALPRQPRREARLGLRARLRRGDVADAPGATSPTTT